MKYSIFAICLLFFSCDSNSPVKETVQKEYKLNLSDTQVTITEYTIDGCQYIGYLGSFSNSNYLTHKGNCTNSIHNHISTNQ